MTERFHITGNDQVTLFQRALRLKRYDDAGYVFEELDKPDLTHRIGFAEFTHLLAGPDMVLQRDFFSPGNLLREVKHGEAGALTRAQDDEQMTALWRKACVDAFYTLYLQQKVKRKDVWITPVEAELRFLAEDNFGRVYQEAKSRAGQRIEIPKFPKPRTLLTWVRNYENAGYYIDGLVSRYYACGNRHAVSTRKNWRSFLVSWICTHQRKSQIRQRRSGGRSASFMMKMPAGKQRGILN
jgi:hypothetical protein